jgi:hypothetical protein
LSPTTVAAGSVVEPLPWAWLLKLLDLEVGATVGRAASIGAGGVPGGLFAADDGTDLRAGVGTGEAVVGGVVDSVAAVVSVGAGNSTVVSATDDRVVNRDCVAAALVAEVGVRIETGGGANGSVADGATAALGAGVTFGAPANSCIVGALRAAVGEAIVDGVVDDVSVADASGGGLS